MSDAIEDGITVLELPPELSDGQHTTYIRPRDLDQYVLKSGLMMLSVGDSVTIKKTEMEKDEFESLEPV